MGEKKEKKGMSKGMRIFIIVLLSLIILYSLMLIIIGINNNFEQRVAENSTGVYTSLGILLIIDFLCVYGIINNISKLRGKELTAEQLQKRKKRNIIMLVIVIGIVGGISLSNIFDGNFNKTNTSQNTSENTSDKITGTFVSKSEKNNYTSTSYQYWKLIINEETAKYGLYDSYNDQYIGLDYSVEYVNGEINLYSKNNTLTYNIRIKSYNTIMIKKVNGYERIY